MSASGERCLARTAAAWFLLTMALALPAEAQQCSPERFGIQFVQEVEISVVDSVVVTGIPSIDTLNVEYDVIWAESLFVRPTDLAPPDSALYDSLGLGRTYLFGTRDPIVDSVLLADYAAEPEVAFAELDCEYEACSGGRLTGIYPNDPRFMDQWGFANGFWNAGVSDADKNAPEGWLIQQDCVLTAIVDTGIDRYHEDLSTRVWRNDDEMSGDPDVDDDGNGYVDDEWGWNWVHDSPNPHDDHGHGTYVAGIVGAEPDNDKGIAGQCWTYRCLMALKALDSEGFGESSWIAQAISYAVFKGAGVINLSLGEYQPNAMIRQSIDLAYASGCVVVGAMGNDNTPIPFYPASYDNVIAVGATDGWDLRAWFSNYGSQIDVVAPGEMVLSTYPGSSYLWGDGTSVACPHVSGLAALLLHANPGLGNAGVRWIIQTTSDDEVGDLVEDPDGFDDYFGHGRINDYSALAHAACPAYLPLLEDVRISSTRDSMTYTISEPSTACGVKWEIVGVRMPQNPDFQLAVWDSGALWWGTGTPENVVEFIVVQDRSSPAAVVLVDSWGDCGKYAIEWTAPFAGLFPPVNQESEFGAYTWQSAHVVQICCIWLEENYMYQIDLDPSGEADLGMALFRPYPLPDGCYDRYSATVLADEYGSGESETLAHAADTTAWHGLAIWSNNGRNAEYFIRVPQPTGVSDAAGLPPPTALALGEGHPNPFSSQTNIRYDIPSPSRVVLSVYDAAGRRLATLVDRQMTPGRYTGCWDGRDESGVAAAPGVYFCRLRACGLVETRKIVLMK